jgi:DNA-binding transcriptional LysR family regulator
MELRHLRYFVAVAEALSFRGAAERLRVAQPSLSKQIRDLEEECGARLLDRNTTRVRLTDAGAALLAEARMILAQASRLPLLAREAAHGRRGRLTIGNIGSLTAGFLPACLSAFHVKFPEVDVSLIELRSREQTAALRSGRIQIGLIGGPAVPADDDLARVEILRSPLGFLVSARHALASRRAVTLAELTTEPHLAIASEPGGSGHPDIVRGLFLRRGLKAPPIKLVDSLESLFAVVASEQGVSILPRLAGRQREPGVVMKPLKLEGADAAFSLWGVWRRDETSQLVENFIGVVKSQASKPRPAPTVLTSTIGRRLFPGEVDSL